MIPYFVDLFLLMFEFDESPHCMCCLQAQSQYKYIEIIGPAQQANSYICRLFWAECK